LTNDELIPNDENDQEFMELEDMQEAHDEDGW
jgi:hypothetical protein